MLRKFLSLDGEVMAEEEWYVRPTDRCFYCDQHLMHIQGVPCPVGFESQHDFITLVTRGLNS